MRRSTPTNSSAENFERSTRSSVWQLMHSISGSFCSAVPGMLLSHSVLVSCAARSPALRSLRSAVAVRPAATSAVAAPASS